jgi:hypothetical protein
MEEQINLISTFADFKESKSIDRETLMMILKDVFVSALSKKYGANAQFNVIVNVDRGDLEIQHSLEVVEDDEVTEKKGIYEYVLSGCSEHIARRLSKRQFSMTDKRTAYERQNGRCPVCGEEFPFEEMDGDHITAWWRGGKTVLDNLQMVCKKCNGAKGGKSY